jgi:hypothetical protein
MDVEIKLDGKTETLRCSLKAARQVNALGGFSHVATRLQSLDLEYFIRVTAAGLDKKPADIEAAVYATGLPALAGELSKYTDLLANGGKPYRPTKLKTVEIDGKAYAELDARGEPVYVAEEVPGDGTEGEA